MNLHTLFNEQSRADLELTTRRQFLRQCTTGLGGIWLATQAGLAAGTKHGTESALDQLLAHHAPKAKRVIYLHMVGAPSQLELFDFRPELARLDGQDCPQEFLEGKRFAFIQGTPKMLGHQYPFKQYGQSGTWVSDRLPHFSQLVDEVCFIKTMQTDQFNHGPAQLMVHTGNARMGSPSIGSWVTWGLGTENQDLPGFIVLLSGGRQPRAGNALWNSGFLPSVYQGVQCRSKGEPVLNVTNPKGVGRDIRRELLDSLNRLNRRAYDEFGDPETLTRIAQYEMAFRMQTAVPEVMNIEDEPEHIRELYGVEPGKESFANNCLLARRLAEKGVRYIQLFDWGWDSHGAEASEALNDGFKRKCRQVDQPMSALLIDLKQRGMLDDTLLVWSGEFGRTPMRENRGGEEMKLVGRDHNPEAFTLWMAGAGVKAGHTHGETDPMGYGPVKDPVPLRDFHATLLHLLGFNHNRMIVPFQGLNQKLTGVKPAEVVKGVLA
ncbi:MAG TPA: sulfatase [Verrucomicrobiales bacterium]|nr:sulfatase [Verrucomicrobiales bacterium]